MVLRKVITITPRPAPIPDVGDTKWRRLFDRLLFRRSLRDNIAALRDEVSSARLEVEKANDRRSEGASAAHDGMFKIESLGVLWSEVLVQKGRRENNRTATVSVLEINDDLATRMNNYETVAFEGQAYVIQDVTVDPFDYGVQRETTLTLRGVIISS